MMVDRTPAHLADMLRFTQELRSLATAQTAEDFARQRIVCLAVEKLFINLGEAACRIDAWRTGQMPDIPWRKVIGLRNILAHGYNRWRTKSCSRPLPMTCPRWKPRCGTRWPRTESGRQRSAYVPLP